MAKYLKVIQFDADHSIHKQFSSMGDIALNMISDCFMFGAGKIEFSGISKVQIYLDEDISRDSSYKELIDVIVINKFFDLKGFMNLESFDRRKYLLDLLAEALSFLADELSVPSASIQDAYSIALDRINNFRGWIGTAIQNKSVGSSARLYFEYEKLIRVGCVFRSCSDGTEIGVELFDHPPILEAVLKMFGRLSWNEEGDLIIPRKNTSDYWRINRVTKSVNFVFARAELGQAHGMYDLGLMYLNGHLVMKDTNHAKFWLGKASLLGYKKANQALKKVETDEGRPSL